MLRTITRALFHTFDLFLHYTNDVYSGGQQRNNIPWRCNANWIANCITTYGLRLFLKTR